MSRIYYYVEQLQPLVTESDEALIEAMSVLDTHELMAFIQVADHFGLTENELVSYDLDLLLSEEEDLDEGFIRDIVGKVKGALSRKRAEAPSLYQAPKAKSSTYKKDQFHRAKSSDHDAQLRRYAKMARAASSENNAKKLAYAQNMASRYRKAKMKHQANVQGKISKGEEYQRAKSGAIAAEGGKRKRGMRRLGKERKWDEYDD